MKKILIVNAVQIGDKSGTGNTLKNLFKLLPKEKLLQLIVAPQMDGINSDTETLCTPLALCPVPFGIQRKRAQNHNVGMGGGTANKLKTSRLKKFFSGMLDAWPVSCNCLFQRLDEFDPEVIYTCAGSIRIMKVVNAISEHYHIPVVVHLMDDWPNTIYSPSIILNPFRWLALKELGKLYSKTKTNYAISEGLSEKYTAIYHKNHIALMNPAAIYPIDKDDVGPHNERKPVRFLYAGSLSLKRDISLLEIAAVLHDLNAEGFNNVFDIYTSKTLVNEYNNKRFSQYGVHLHPYVSPSQVYELYAKYDVLVFTESFEKEYIDFTAFSLSTKVPEYLASQRAILAYLSEKLFSGKYLAKEQAALVVNNSTELRQSCQRLITDNVLREQLAKKGRKLAENEFSYEQVQQKLEQVFE